LPDVIANLKRRKRINEVLTISRGLGFFLVAAVFAALLYRGAMQSYLRRMQRYALKYIHTFIQCIVTGGPTAAVELTVLNDGIILATEICILNSIPFDDVVAIYMQGGLGEGLQGRCGSVEEGRAQGQRDRWYGWMD
jgi:hypothetical protein